MKVMTRLIDALPRGGTLPYEQWAQRHRGILTLLWLHAIGVPCFGILSGNSAFLSAAAGLTIAAIAGVGSLTILSRNARAAMTTVGLMVAASLLVHLSGGIVEMHFHFFVLLAVIVLYQDWVPFLVALILIVGDHGIMGMLVPFLVYNHSAAQHHPWTWAAIHGLFILAEGAALLVYWRVNENARCQSRESEERTRSIVDNALDAVIVIDDRGRITEWNPQAEQTFGWSRAETIGLFLSQVILPLRYREAHENRLRTYLETGEGPMLRERIEITAQRRGGTEFPIEFSVTPLRLESGTTFSTFIRDITERHQAEHDLLCSKEATEAAESASRAKSQFLANMSHEIRTPMNGVLGMTELLLADKLNSRQRHLTENIQRSGQTLMEIINDILDFSKIEAGKLQLEQLDFDVQETVEDAVEFFADPAQRKGLELTYYLPGSFQRMLCGDPVRLRQALLNLLGNAVKFTAQGGIHLCVELVADTAEAVTLRFAVQDSGIGIPVEAQARVLDAFSQADGSTTRRFGGTGLGLTIVKELVELMHGQIGVESRPGEGSTFWFTAVFQRPSCAANRVPHEEQHLLHNKKILVVDDTAINREILEAHLRGWGATPTLVSSGQDALKCLQAAVGDNQLFDLAILDLQMPEMDGLMLAHAIRSDQQLSGLRLLMLSSIGYDTSRPPALEIDSWVTKPIRKNLLHQALLGLCQEAPRIQPPPKSEQLAVATSAQAEPKHILLVEDVPVNREVAIGMLELLGHWVDVAENGQEAVDAVARTTYDLVLMDCQMPTMDGFTASGAIREQERLAGHARRLPIIALTALAIEGDRQRCLAAGMDDYLAKPFTQGQLKDILSHWLSQTNASSSQRDPGSALPEAAPVSSVPTSQAEQIESTGVVDYAAWQPIRMLKRPGHPDPLGRLLAKYLEDSRQLVDQLRHAIESNDPAALNAVAHRLKSSSATLGALTVAARCKELEALGRDRRIEEAPDRFRQLERDFDAVCSVFQAALNKEPSHDA